MASELMGQGLLFLLPWAALAVYLHPVRHSQLLAALHKLQSQQVLSVNEQQSALLHLANCWEEYFDPSPVKAFANQCVAMVNRLHGLQSQQDSGLKEMAKFVIND